MTREEWLKWRKEGIGSSDAPVIMGVSPWKTPLQLWEEKTGKSESDEKNWATDRGNELEASARAHYELAHGIECPPKLFIHKEHPFLRASLDGYNSQDEIVLEIKCPGKEDHEKALKGLVPEKYYPQLQHQLLVSGARRVDYFSFFEDQGTTVHVGPDFNYIKKLLKAEIEFWERVKTGVPPDPSDKDYIEADNEALIVAIKNYCDAENQSKEAEIKKEEMRKFIIENTPHPRLKYGTFRMWKTVRRGTIDYKLVPALETVDLEAYRKPSTESYTLKVGA